MKEEKIRFLKTSLLFILCFLITFIAYIIILFQFSYTPGVIFWERDCFVLKDKIIFEKSSPKVIIISGSNGLFGVSAEQIEKETGIPAVNYATNGDIRDYMFEKIKRVTKEGDIILIPLEYEFYYYNKKIMFQPQEVRERYILTYDQEYFNNQSPLNKINIVTINLRNLIVNVVYQYKNISTPYRIKDINEWGDYSNYAHKKDFNKKYPLIAFPADFNKKFPDYDGPKEIVELSKWARYNNITLIASFPSTLYLKEYNNSEHKKIFENIIKFYKENNIPIIGTPYDFFYSEDMMYDDRYHLNEKGKEIRTEFIINQLKPYVNRNIKNTNIKYYEKNNT